VVAAVVHPLVHRHVLRSSLLLHAPTQAPAHPETKPATPAPAQELFTAAPCLWFRPKPIDAHGDYPHYSCPVYRTAERRGTLATTGGGVRCGVKGGGSPSRVLPWRRAWKGGRLLGPLLLAALERQQGSVVRGTAAARVVCWVARLPARHARLRCCRPLHQLHPVCQAAQQGRRGALDHARRGHAGSAQRLRRS